MKIVCDATVGVGLFDAAASAQRAVPFDAEVQGYGSFEARAAIEGRHPDILAELCAGLSVLDVGCGPGYLVRMLRDRGVRAVGCDPYVAPVELGCHRAQIANWADLNYDVVVCREVLEHVPVREWGAFLHHLFRVARRYVYITTRFTPDPAHPFDLTTELDVDPSHITRLPQPFVRALCVVQGGTRDWAWEQRLDWQGKGRVLVYRVGRGDA